MSQDTVPPTSAPDPASSYGRENPEKEAGAGRLDNNHDATPADQPDRMDRVIANPHDPRRQINAQDSEAASTQPANQPDLSRRSDEPADRPREQPDHSMLDEEPRGEDLRPEEREPLERRRHPETKGKGGTR